jgi:phosphoribosyl 1,2-cyclic phosphodiesterase
MFIKILSSGSRGNSIYIESKETSILIDAGISAKRAEERLDQCDRRDAKIDAILISHDHSDHTCSAGIFHRRFSAPLHMTRKTFQAIRHDIGEVEKPKTFAAGDQFAIGNLRIETISTPHDGVDGVCFVVDNGEKRLGVLTDLGHCFPALCEVMPTLDGLILESNYDSQMLENGPYPAFLKKRVRGPGGHLSNREAASLVGQSGDRIRWVCLAHISEKNNTPQKALEAFRKIHSPKRQVVAVTQEGQMIQPTF